MVEALERFGDKWHRYCLRWRARRQQFQRRDRRAPQMARGDAKIGGEFFEPLQLQRARFDPLQRIVGETVRCVDWREARRKLGPAQQAGTKARLLGRRRRREKLPVPRLRHPRRAHAPAIDARRGHAGEEEAIEPFVAGLDGGVSEDV